MMTPYRTSYGYEPETVDAARKLTANTVSEHEHKTGMLHGEPLIVILDCLLKYAKAYKNSFDSRVADDGVLGDTWKETMKSFHGFFDGDGAIALNNKSRSDSKCNGALEEVYWAAVKVAGFTEEDML